MNNVVIVKIVDSAEHLLDCLRSILLGELSLVANSVKEFASGGQLRDDVELVLGTKGQPWVVNRAAASWRTLDSNQSTNLTM